MALCKACLQHFSQYMTFRSQITLGLTILLSTAPHHMAEGSPWGWKALRLVYPIPESVASGGIRKLPLTVTVPDTLPASTAASAQEHQTERLPVVLFFSGFKLKASYYSKYAQGLAAQGYAVLQYDTPFLKLPNDATEVAWLPGLLSWLQAQSEDASSPLHMQLDLTRIGAAGHSRGGKLAALHLAGSSQVSAAYLIDPVDNTSQTPESAEYPSACKALRGTDKPAAITGAGIGGPCNPEGSNSPVFFSAVKPGSWYMKVFEAGHASFFKAPWLIQKAADLLCHRGKESHEGTVTLAITPMLAWFDRHLRRSSTGSQAQDDFFQWVKKEEQAGRVSFQVKEQQDAPVSNIVPFPVRQNKQQEQPESSGSQQSADTSAVHPQLQLQPQS